MRLLRTETLQFTEQLHDDEIPAYAILSHTWGKNEVTFKDMQKRRLQAEEMQGYVKIMECAKRALKDGLEYCWVDSCCIDKSSSAELTEAINSMYRWYRNATVCYAYMSDVPEKPVEDSSTLQNEWSTSFAGSRWFTRGWTLQELIAPTSLVFFCATWTKIGTKHEMTHRLESITGVPWKILLSGDPGSASVAQRMSWAANRTTSRVEDMAYCLLGIFDINMVMLYGEGKKAFLRLQEEIIRTSDDRSIFAWCDPTASFSVYRGLLATRVSHFEKGRDVIWGRTSQKPYNITNMGIHLDLQLRQREARPNEFVAPLFGVSYRSLGPKSCVGIYLQLVGDNQYARVQMDQLALVQASFTKEEQFTFAYPFIRQKTIMEVPNHSRCSGVSLRLLTPSLVISNMQPPERWSEVAQAFILEKPFDIAPPPRLSFSLAGSVASANLTVVMDLSQDWGKLMTIRGAWRQQQKLNKSTHKTYCRGQGWPAIVTTLQRGLVGEEARLTLSMEENSDI